jgi:hypothetical protein
MRLSGRIFFVGCDIGKYALRGRRSLRDFYILRVVAPVGRWKNSCADQREACGEAGTQVTK